MTMEQERSLWDLLFGVSDPGLDTASLCLNGNVSGNLKMELDGEATMPMDLPDELLALLNGNDNKCNMWDKEELAGSAGVGVDCASWAVTDLDPTLSAAPSAGNMELDLHDLSEFLQVTPTCEATSGSGSDDCSLASSSSPRPTSLKHNRSGSTSSNSSTTSSDSGQGTDKKSQQELVLSPEELLLLGKEGLSLPKFLPLNKQQERLLKKIRRKIRNKKSAQESRRKKKVYVDQLEDQLKDMSTTNKQLNKRVKELEKENSNLQAQLKTLQSLLGQALPLQQQPQRAHLITTRSTKTTGTCLMALVLSVALIVSPYGKGGHDKDSGGADNVHLADYQGPNGPAPTRMLYNVDTGLPPDISQTKSLLPLMQEKEVTLQGEHVHYKTSSNSVVIEPWQENYASQVTLLPVGENDSHVMSEGFESNRILRQPITAAR